MSAPVLLDTHAWVWSFAASSRLSGAARAAIRDAAGVHVSPISFFEIGQKVRLGKWPEMAGHAAALPDLLARQGGVAAALTPRIALDAALMDWAHRDPFDRLIAATAESLSLALVTCDAAFAGRPAVRTIW